MQQLTQIAYIPDHAEGDINHPDVEFGFVDRRSNTNGDKYFCRYWRKGEPGKLRTVANSELTHARNLVEHDLLSEKDVERVALQVLDLLVSRYYLGPNSMQVCVSVESIEDSAILKFCDLQNPRLDGTEWNKVERDPDSLFHPVACEKAPTRIHVVVDYLPCRENTNDSTDA